MGTGNGGEPLRRADHGAGGAREIKERRDGARRDDGWRRSGAPALQGGRDQIGTPTISGDFSREQRDYAGRARSCLHDFPQWRLATQRAAHSRSDRGEGWNRRLGVAEGSWTANGDQTGNGLRSSLVSRGRAGKRNRTSCAREIRPPQISGRRENRNCLRFHRRTFRRLRQLDYLCGLGWVRQAPEDLSWGV